MCRLLIDTNILIDSLFPDRIEHLDAIETINRCSGHEELGMASSASFKDVYYIAQRKNGESWARNAVRKLMGLLVVTPTDAEVYDMALNSDEPDFEDGIIRACAELNGADFIITRDKAAFAHSKVRSVTAAEYLKIARSNEVGYPWND